MKRILILILTLAIFLPVVACDDDPKGNNSNLTREQFLSQVASRYPTEYCDYLERCPQAGGEEWMADGDTCRVVLGQFLIGEFMMEMEWALDNGAVHDGAALNACMNGIRTLSCDADPDSIAACNEVLSGTVANGGACSNNWQCVSGFCNTEEVCPGTCAPRVALNGDCESWDQCQTGLECDWDTGKCVQPAPKANQGGACEWHDDCKYGLYCLVTNFETYEGVCDPWLEAGESCDGDGAMDYVCEPGLGCDYENTGNCTTIQTVGVGQACDGDVRVCDMAQRAVCGGDTCIQLPAAGSPCMMGEYCWFGNYCDATTTCRAAKANGATCGDDDECLSEWCDNGTCAYAPCGNYGEDEEPI